MSRKPVPKRPVTKKGCLLVGGFMVAAFVVAIGGFGLLVWFSASHQEDQSYLTEHVDAKVLATRDHAETWGVIYSYQVGDKTYYDEVEMNERGWRPGHGVDVCFDPHNPVRHAVAYGGGWCGSNHLYSGTSDGQKTRPSW